MAGLREILNRFRPTGAPGAATAAGVPSDRRAGVEAELEPVFAAMAATVDRCHRIEAAAAAWSQRTAAAAQERADSALAQARTDAPAARAAAAARILAAAKRDAEGIDGAAAYRLTEAAQLAASARHDLVKTVLARVRADIAALDGAEPR